MTRFDIKAFTPSREDPSALEERTVGRTVQLEVIRQRLAAAATTTSRQHTLLVGPRGAGKSHVLEVTLNRLSHEPYAHKFRIARLPEDVVGISNAEDVLLHTALALSVPSQVVAEARAARADHNLVALERIVADEIGESILLLVIENLDRVFGNLGISGQSDLRAWVETNANVFVLATAPLLFHAVQSRVAPWYGSFAVEHLAGLSIQDGTVLIQHIAERMGDRALSDFVASPIGQSRLAAVHPRRRCRPRSVATAKVSRWIRW